MVSNLSFSKFVNVAVPGTIPELAINKNHPLNIFQKSENLNLAISSAKSIGCIVVNIHAPLIVEKKEHIAFGLLWQAIRVHDQ
jgi:plastin-1